MARSRLLVFTGLLMLASAASASAPTTAPLASRFADPPARFRIMKIIHGLPPTPKAQDALLDSLAGQGFGGLVTNVPFKDYLRSEPMWQVFTRSVSEAKKRGMAMWLYDEHGYPSGNAGGLTMEGHPEWEARGLYFADAASKGGPVAFDLPPGKLRRVAAFPVSGGAIELDKAVDLAKSVKDGKLAWTAPAGQWRVIAISEDRLYENTHAAVSLADKLPYINLLMKEPTARFIQLTHQAYADRLGDRLGQSFIATFTDEPSLMSMFFRPSPWRVIPWSPAFAEEFKARRGYAIEPLLPALAAPAGGRGAKARYEYWLTVAELVSQNFFGQIRDWCRAHGIPSGGHLLLEEPLLAHVPLYGDLFRCERMLDAPSLDCLTSLPPQVHWHSARLVASVGELLGRPDNMCETSDHQQRYRPAGDKRPVVPVSEAQIRGTCNRLIVSGITGITSYYSFAGLDESALRRLNLWIGRCAAMLYGGKQAADIAVLYPIESVWPKFEPSHVWTNDLPEDVKRIEKAYRAAADQLFFNQRDFTFIDSEVLTQGKVEGGAFKYNGLSWRAVVLPCADTLPLKAWRNLEAFWRGGGIVIAVGVLPANSEGEFPAPEVQKIAREMFGAGTSERTQKSPAGGTGVYLPDVKAERLSAVLGGLLAPDLKVASPGSPLRVTHRRIAGNEIYFLINDSDQVWSGEVGLAATGKGERYDPATGAVAPLTAPAGIALKLEPYGAALFRFDAPKQ